MKTLDDLKISKKAKLQVKTWLEEWLNTLIAQANGREGTVHRADFEQDDFFYFTDCTDILGKEPESLGQEANIKIIKRKQKVMLQLFIKTLLGTVVCKKIKCSHCGYPDRYIGPLSNRTGHFIYCPKCKYTTIATYPAGYNTCISDIEKYRNNKAVVEIRDNCREIPKTNCASCCKDIPDKDKFHFNCKYYKLTFNEEPCKSCIKHSNWKSRGCKCKN